MTDLRPPTDAELAWARGDWADAWPPYRDWLVHWVRHRPPASPVSADELVALERTADLAVPLGHLDVAGHLLDALAHVCQDAGNTFAARHASLKRAELSLVANQPADAQRRLSLLVNLSDVPTTPDAMPAWEASIRWSAPWPGWDAVLRTRLYFCLGRLAVAAGCFGQADALFQRGRHHAGPSAVPLARAFAVPLTLEEADSLLQQGRVADAVRILDGLNRLPPGQTVRRLELLGHAGLLAGRLGDALRHFAEVSALCRLLGLREAIREALVNQARALLAANQLAGAQALLAQADELRRPEDDPSATVRIALLGIEAHARSRNQFAGDVLAPSATEMQEGSAAPSPILEPDLPEPIEPPGYTDRFARLSLRVRRALARDDVGSAAQALCEAFADFAATESPLIGARLNGLKAAVALSAGQPALAREAAREAGDAFAGLELRPEAWQALRLRIAGEDRPAVRDELVRRAHRLNERLAGSLSEAEALVWHFNQSSAEDEALNVEAALLAREPERAGERLPAFLQTASRHRRALERVVLGSSSSPWYSGERGGVSPSGSFPTREPPPKREEPEGLTPPRSPNTKTNPQNRATLTCVVLPERVVSVIAHAGRVGYTVTPVPRLTVRRLVRQFHQAVAVPGDPTAVISELAESLRWPELLSTLPADVSRLTVEPDDVLHGFPFAVLPLNGRPLIERFAVSIGPNTTGPANVSRSALVVAVPDGVDSPPPELGVDVIAPLPNTVGEARQVADWLRNRGVTADMRASPTRSAVLAAWPTAGLVHVACHGLFRPERPDASGLLMVPVDGPPEMLSLADLVRLRPTGLQHVTLSSCWGADSFAAPGRWVLSLPTALRLSGVGSVLSCLWPVLDVVAPAFSRRFYHYCESMPRDEALQRVQRDCLRGDLRVNGPVDTSAVHVWAGFVLHGDTGPLRL